MKFLEAHTILAPENVNNDVAVDLNTVSGLLHRLNAMLATFPTRGPHAHEESPPQYDE